MCPAPTTIGTWCKKYSLRLAPSVRSSRLNPGMYAVAPQIERPLAHLSKMVPRLGDPYCNTNPWKLESINRRGLYILIATVQLAAKESYTCLSSELVRTCGKHSADQCQTRTSYNFYSVRLARWHLVSYFSCLFGYVECSFRRPHATDRPVSTLIAVRKCVGAS